jgi:phasin
MAGTPPNFEIPEQMRTMAEQSVGQAKKAFDDMMAASQKAVQKVEGSAATVQAGATDMNKKILSYAEENVAAAFAFAQNLARAKTFQDVVTLQNDFLKAQMAALGEQTRVLSDTAAKAATDAANAMKP